MDFNGRTLLDDNRVFSVRIAQSLGVDEAIFLQQLHWFLQSSGKKIDGGGEPRWVWNSIDSWAKQFPFWSGSKIRRTISFLEDKKVVVSGRFNKLPFDQTKWYRIDYEELERRLLVTENASEEGSGLLVL